jgi:hypothetical protein
MAKKRLGIAVIHAVASNETQEQSQMSKHDCDGNWVGGREES